MPMRPMSRRGVVQLGAASLVAGAAIPSRGGGALGAQDDAGLGPLVMTDGYAGGGTVPSALGEAQFSLAVFVRDRGDGSPVTVSGSFQLKDLSDPVNPVTMASDELTSYTAFSTDRPNARQVTGWARVNGTGPFPFLLQVEDMAAVGDATDTVNLVFGDAALPFLPGSDAGKACDCGGFSYSLKGTVATGDLVRFALA